MSGYELKMYIYDHRFGSTSNSSLYMMFVESAKVCMTLREEKDGKGRQRLYKKYLLLK